MGLVGEADSPPVNVTPTSWRGWNLSIEFIYFKGCIPNTLEFQGKLEESAPFLRVPLSIVFVWRFPEEAPKLSEKFLS